MLLMFEDDDDDGGGSGDDADDDDAFKIRLLNLWTTLADSYSNVSCWSSKHSFLSEPISTLILLIY